MSTGRSCARRGFTMLEAIIALAIVALVCVGVLGAYGSAIRADVTAVDRLPLAALAVERLAQVDIESGDLSHLPDSLARGVFAAPYAGATWEVETRRVTESDGLFDVAVRVRDGNDQLTLRTRRYRAPVTVVRALP